MEPSLSSLTPPRVVEGAVGIDVKSFSHGWSGSQGAPVLLHCCDIVGLPFPMSLKLDMPRNLLWPTVNEWK